MAELAGWAQSQPDKAALVFADSGAIVTFAQLDDRANRVAHWLIGLGLGPGDGVAYLLDNSPTIFELAFAARRAGLYYTPLNTSLRPAEIAYVLKDSGARVLVVGPSLAALAQEICAGLDHPPLIFALGSSYDEAMAAVPGPSPLPPRPLGRDFIYSSGTTGLPKGIRKPLVPYADKDREDPEVTAWRRAFEFDAASIYLSPAPLHHAAPIRYCMRTIQLGGTSVVLRKFVAEAALRAIPQYGVTHSQWAPVMFVRLLALPQAVRDSCDLSTMRYAIHAAAPCPIALKQQMLDWWGDCLWEFYGGSEGLGLTRISSAEWRDHQGSVGRAVLGQLHILDEGGAELPAGQIGRIFFSGGPVFEYFNDPDKTRAAHDHRGWATYGDLGHLDPEGYLYISGRRTDLIISGGVNIYPQEIEDCLSAHPQVQDVAVVGVPDAEYGEAVKAVVQLRDPAAAGPPLAAELIAFCRARLPGFKTPKSVDFDPQLPRQDNGKLLKRQIKDRYWDPTGRSM